MTDSRKNRTRLLEVYKPYSRLKISTRTLLPLSGQERRRTLRSRTRFLRAKSWRSQGSGSRSLPAGGQSWSTRSPWRRRTWSGTPAGRWISWRGSKRWRGRLRGCARGCRWNALPWRWAMLLEKWRGRARLLMGRDGTWRDGITCYINGREWREIDLGIQVHDGQKQVRR